MSKQGKLKCQCYEGDTIKPLVNSKITLTNDKNVLVKEFYTDSSGESELVLLDTPDISASQKPGTIPYSIYNVLIEKEGFKPLQINGVQIYPNRVGIQSCNMKMATARDNRTEVLDIKPNRLIGGFEEKIPEEPVKLLPKPSNTVVLPEVVVPQLIVVHDGSPSDDAAPNHTIAYIDYIKNVASSEIFATWPKATIMANVYCIVSFTLNRIYTEWYRGKGKDFDVTNNTAYDQAYVHGRTIYDSVSDVVDQYFASYIRKFNEKQPFLAQYCNGTTSKHEGWLTQWGSKYLGDQGKTPYEILTHFYGYNIDIAKAPKVKGIPMSFPGYTLKLHYNGIYVKRVQIYLNSISNNYPLINKVAVDGIYGDSTAKAVRTYQRIFNLPITGAVNYGTWYSISNTYVAVNKLAEMSRGDEEETGYFVAPSMFNFEKNLPRVKY